jgi:hypothetical protein
MRDDASSVWLGGYTPGSAAVINNSYARLDCSRSFVYGYDKYLIIYWNITFKAPFAGTTPKKTYLYVSDDNGNYSGWRQQGTWMIR